MAVLSAFTIPFTLIFPPILLSVPILAIVPFLVSKKLFGSGAEFLLQLVRETLDAQELATGAGAARVAAPVDRE